VKTGVLGPIASTLVRVNNMENEWGTPLKRSFGRRGGVKNIETQKKVERKGKNSSENIKEQRRGWSKVSIHSILE